MAAPDDDEPIDCSSPPCMLHEVWDDAAAPQKDNAKPPRTPVRTADRPKGKPRPVSGKR